MITFTGSDICDMDSHFILCDRNVHHVHHDVPRRQSLQTQPENLQHKIHFNHDNTLITTISLSSSASSSLSSSSQYSLQSFSFQPVLHDWCNKGRCICYPVCGMVHIKEPLLLIVKSSLCGGSGFPFSLSEWSLTICLTPYNRK